MQSRQMKPLMQRCEPGADDTVNTFQQGKARRALLMEHAPASPELLLIGRERDRALLWSHFQAAARGQTRVVLIEGPPGIGKTCLLDPLATHARQQGVLVLRGGASEAEGMPPYLPFLEALGQHIPTATSHIVREQPGALASVLAT